METGSAEPKLRWAVYLSFVLFIITLAQTLAIVWLSKKPKHTSMQMRDTEPWEMSAGFSNKPVKQTGMKLPRAFRNLVDGKNMVQERYPTVDFSKIYPDLSSKEIDQLQRECFGVRYVFAPFVQFKPVPVTNAFVQISPAGFRWGAEAQPWPPLDEDFVVFVFGGSTTFGYGLPNDGTLVAQLQRELRQLWPDKRVQCYNFGRGYFFSTQERLLFELLLEDGHIPDLAIFVDGVNDLSHVDGKPRLTDELSSYVDGELATGPSPPPAAANSKSAAVGSVVNRLRNHMRLTRALGEAYEAATVFIGQPVPFFDYPKTPETYPFGSEFPRHELGAEFYVEFQETGQRGEFGPYFIWCGDVFSKASTSMYADNIHYSPLGANILARAMATRIDEKLRLKTARPTALFQKF